MIKFNKRRLIALRELKGLSQVDFAKRLGTSRQHINAIESGKNVPGTKMLERIANEFNVPIGSLFEEV